MMACGYKGREMAKVDDSMQMDPHMMAIMKMINLMGKELITGLKATNIRANGSSAYLMVKARKLLPARTLKLVILNIQSMKAFGEMVCHMGQEYVSTQMELFMMDNGEMDNLTAMVVKTMPMALTTMGIGSMEKLTEKELSNLQTKLFSLVNGNEVKYYLEK
jgi:hypothetical protein